MCDKSKPPGVYVKGFLPPGEPYIAFNKASGTAPLDLLVSLVSCALLKDEEDEEDSC